MFLHLITQTGESRMILVCSLTSCSSDDTIGDLKKLIAAQTGTKAEKIVLKKW